MIEDGATRAGEALLCFQSRVEDGGSGATNLGDIEGERTESSTTRRASNLTSTKRVSIYCS